MILTHSLLGIFPKKYLLKKSPLYDLLARQVLLQIRSHKQDFVFQNYLLVPRSILQYAGSKLFCIFGDLMHQGHRMHRQG